MLHLSTHYITFSRCLLFVLLLVGCKQTEVTPTKSKDLVPLTEHMLLGNPSNATADLANENNFLLQNLNTHYLTA